MRSLPLQAPRVMDRGAFRDTDTITCMASTDWGRQRQVVPTTDTVGMRLGDDDQAPRMSGGRAQSAPDAHPRCRPCPSAPRSAPIYVCMYAPAVCQICPGPVVVAKGPHCTYWYKTLYICACTAPTLCAGSPRNSPNGSRGCFWASRPLGSVGCPPPPPAPHMLPRGLPQLRALATAVLYVVVVVVVVPPAAVR